MFERITADILSSDAQVIVQQCFSDEPCTGVSAKMEKRFPHATFTYHPPGFIEVAGSKKRRQRLVLAMFVGLTLTSKKEEWLEKCLDRAARIKNLTSIDFPLEICDKVSEEMISDWAKKVPGVRVRLLVPPDVVTPDRIMELSVEKKMGLLEHLIFDVTGHVLESATHFLTSKVELTWDISLLEFTKKYLRVKDWPLFEGEESEQILKDIDSFLKKEELILPPIKDVFAAFELCPLSDLKVVIIGQDPYHTPGAAMGVAFGHHPGRRLQPSLRNIYKALKNDGFEVDEQSGDLTRWCVQGVLLLNTALTVAQGKAGSHMKAWKYFTERTLHFINDATEHVVVMAWGREAQNHAQIFDDDKHFVIAAPHPAAANYNPKNNAFFDHKPFSEANSQLKKWEMEEIDWNLD